MKFQVKKLNNAIQVIQLVEFEDTWGLKHLIQDLLEYSVGLQKDDRYIIILKK